MLFKPFNAPKWFVLGFAAFLAYLAEGFYTNANSIPTPGGRAGRTLPEVLEDIRQWFLGNVQWVLPVAFTLLLLWILTTWVRARGKFIFLDGVARNHAAIVAPWKRLRAESNSFFRFDLIFSLSVLLAFVVVVALAYAIALPDLRRNTMTAAGITALSVGAMLLIALVVVFWVVVWIAEDFLIPLMYLRSQTIGPAWTEFRTRILSGNLGQVMLFGVMRFVLGIAAAAIVTAGTCVTCCVAAIPYVSSVVFLPLFVFSRAYPLYFLAQFGDEYRVMTEMQPPPISAFPVIFAAKHPPPLEPLPPKTLEPAPPPPPISPEGDQRSV